MCRTANTTDERDLCTHHVEFVISRETFDQDHADITEFLAVEHREGFYVLDVEPVYTAATGTQYDAILKLSSWLTSFEFQLWLRTTGIGF